MLLMALDKCLLAFSSALGWLVFTGWNRHLYRVLQFSRWEYYCRQCCRMVCVGGRGKLWCWFVLRQGFSLPRLVPNLTM